MRSTDMSAKKDTSSRAGAIANLLGAKAVVGKLAGRQGEKLPNRVKLLVSIVGKRDLGKLKDVIDECSVALTIVFAGTGTAHSQVLDYLGIGETEKKVVLSLIPESDEEEIVREIRTRISLYLVGRGISFTIPLTGVSEIVANAITGAAALKTVDGSKVMTNETRKYDLIVAAVAAGFAEEAMEAARSVGAAGGTVIHAHTYNNAKAEQFIGVSLLEERDLLLILTKREGRQPIMQKLFDAVGLKTQAGGIIFSLPVDKTVGISAGDEMAAEENG